MNCCGQKRWQLHQEITNQENHSISSEPVLENPVQLHYHGSHNYLVKGPQTGYLYLFGPGESLMVDGRDASLLLSESRKLFLADEIIREKTIA